jgi:hypothetical protein
LAAVVLDGLHFKKNELKRDHAFETQERAAILEFDGNLKRTEAERLAGLKQCKPT